MAASSRLGVLMKLDKNQRKPRVFKASDLCPYYNRRVMAHNHLSDVALPSRADLAATLKIRETLLSIGVTLADHIIVSGDEYVSMRDSGCFIDF